MVKGLDDIKRKASVKLIGQVDPNELAVRLIEAHGGIRRPAGKTARDLLNDMPDEIAATALMQAHAAITYMAECFGKLERPQ